MFLNYLVADINLAEVKMKAHKKLYVIFKNIIMLGGLFRAINTLFLSGLCLKQILNDKAVIDM